MKVCPYCYGTKRQPGYAHYKTYGCIHCWFRDVYGKKNEAGWIYPNYQNAGGREDYAKATYEREGGYRSTSDIGTNTDAGGDVGEGLAGRCPECGTETTQVKAKWLCKNNRCTLFNCIIENCCSD